MSRKEYLIYPPTIMSSNREDGGIPGEKYVEVPYDLYERAEVGKTYTAWASAPGTGYVTKLITRKDETGAYGYVVNDTIRILHPCEVR